MISYLKSLLPLGLDERLQSVSTSRTDVLSCCAYTLGGSAEVLIDLRRRLRLARGDEGYRVAEEALSYALGCAFGRWDIRFATGERRTPSMPEPFAPLSVCPPGMLGSQDGQPLRAESGRRLRAEGRYPLDAAWDGLLVDDPEHPLDLERMVQSALGALWGDRADAWEHEACAVIGVRSLREWFRHPLRFFSNHLKRYSKSRRLGPIYWPLSTPNGTYTVWLYYHRVNRDTLYKALEIVQERLNYEGKETPQAKGGRRTRCCSRPA